MKTNPGHFLEDFQIGQIIRHASPRTITSGDAAIYTAIYGARFAVQASDPVAISAGYARAPLDDFLVFHMVFGKSVPDVSLNAVANLGYAEGIFHQPVFAGDTLFAQSEVIGIKENSNGKTGTVYVHTTGLNQHGDTVLSFKRWVMINKKNTEKPLGITRIPAVLERVLPENLAKNVPVIGKIDADLWGASHRFGDYSAGEKIDHADGVTVEEAEHMIATRLYHNTARVHFNQFAEKNGRFGKRLIYGGHVISIARALSFNGLGNAFHIAAINGGRHIAPLFAGDTVFAWSEILEKAEIPGRDDIGAVRVMTRATKNLPCDGFPESDGNPNDAGVILALDYWAILPR
ncbi:MAG: MaoC family dehydratase [Aestuariivirgaceae bacterium]|nr:MaoC family dehydratase [Aestuariivirgaceae bacterium]